MEPRLRFRVVGSAGDHRVTLDRHPITQEAAIWYVIGEKPRLLCPHTVSAREDIGGTASHAAGAAVGCPCDNSASVYCHGISEMVIGFTVVREKLLFLNPTLPRA